MRFTRHRPFVALALASVGLLGLAACSSGEEDAPAASSQTPEEPTVETKKPVVAEGQPEWANPVTTGGELISTIEAGDITVQVYQAGVTQATKTGQFANPDTNKPIIDVGADIVFVNYVVTNGGAPIDLGSSFVSIEARYDDWPYVQGMDSIVDGALFEAQGVNADVLATGAFRTPSVYTFGANEQFSFGQNFLYQAGSPITFSVRVTPVDADGKLVHDKKVEAKGTGTIS